MAKQKTKSKSTKAAKKVAKSSKKTVAKASGAKKIAKKAARRAPVPDILSLEERAKLLKPRTDFIEVLERTTREWQIYRDLRVPGLTAAKLGSLGKKATRATEKENAAEEALRRKLVPLADARRIAHDAAYRALLDTHAAVKLHARLDPGIVERFSFLADLVRNQATTEEPEEDANDTDAGDTEPSAI